VFSSADDSRDANVAPAALESSPLLYNDDKDAGIGVKDVNVDLASGDSTSAAESAADKESESKAFLSQSEEPPLLSTQRVPYNRHESVPKVSFVIG